MLGTEDAFCSTANDPRVWKRLLKHGPGPEETDTRTVGPTAPSGLRQTDSAGQSCKAFSEQRQHIGEDNASMQVCYLQALEGLFIFPPRLLLLFTSSQTTLLLKRLHFFSFNSLI